MSDGYRFCVSIKLNTHTDDELFLQKSFRIGEIMKQRTESFLSKQLDKLRMDRLYCDALESYRKVTKQIAALSYSLTSLLEKGKLTRDERRKKRSIESEIESLKEAKTDISTALSDRRSYYGLDRSGVDSFIKVQQKKYKKYIPSQTAQVLAEDCLKAVDKILYGRGKKISFTKGGTLMTLSGKSASTGIRFYYDNKSREGFIVFQNHRIRIKPVRGKDLYMQKILEDIDKTLCFCHIMRLPTNTGFDYYVQLVVKGVPPMKENHKYGKDTADVGIDEGPSTIAVVPWIAEHMYNSDHSLRSIELHNCPDAQ